MELSDKMELKELKNKRNRLINQRAFMRRNCDIIVLQSKRLSYDAYNDILNALSQKIHLSGIEIRNLRAKIYPNVDLRTNRAVSGLERILNDL